MKRKLLVLLAMCAFAIAMVPRDRRAVNTEEEVEHKVQHKEVCDKQTPCAWHVYTPPLRIITLNITNTYCDCAVGMVCSKYEDDTSVSAFVYRCRAPTTPPKDGEETDESDS